MQCSAKAFSFWKSVIEKEKTLKDLEHAQENVEKEFKNIEPMGKAIRNVC